MCSSQTSIAITLVKVGVFTHLAICSCIILFVCVYQLKVFLVACVCGFVLGGILVVLMLLCIAYLEVVSCGFSWVVWGKVIVGPHR